MTAWIFAGDEAELDSGFGIHPAQALPGLGCLPDEPVPSRAEIEAEWNRRRAGRELVWQIRSEFCERRVAVGDRVFVWVSEDDRNGIVRVGRISELHLRPTLYRDPDGGHHASTARLSLEGTDRPRRIRRNAMLRDELLGGLEMVRDPLNPPPNTELRVDQERRLMEMWDALGAPPG